MTAGIPEKLKECGLGVKTDAPMKDYTTFGAGGCAAVLATADSEEALTAAVDMLEETQTDWFLLGNGSNILVADAGYDGVMLKLGEGFERIITDKTKIIAGGAVMLSKVARAAETESLTGLEFASGIPGTVGGAVTMNAGAYDGEMRDVVTEARIYFPGKGVETLKTEELHFGYRHSVLKEERGVLISAVLGLQFGIKKDIIDKVAELTRRRREKQPLEYRSAGSTFKRPEGSFAGKLIMEAGLAGYTCGGACVSEKHCGFIINRENATASDIYEVIKTVQGRVKEHSGYELEPEVILLGDFSKK
ncbi:MAG: UDP-N-acetylmuramate dehydrogenase [Lachnospiraceae bacterium]|nr:UDP-N-acetylmuramate dehydrogenase [Lachnospiraceae bacterium]